MMRLHTVRPNVSSISSSNGVARSSTSASSLLSKGRTAVRSQPSGSTLSLARGYGVSAPSMTRFIAQTPQISVRGFATGKKGVAPAEIVEDKPGMRNLETTSKDLAEICNAEIQAIQDFETDSIHAETAQKWLTESGYKLENVSEKDADGDVIPKIVLTKTVGNHNVKVSFVPWEEDEAEAEEESQKEEGQQEDEEQDAEAEQEEQPETDMPEESGVPNTQAVTIEVVRNKQGKPKGTITMKGFAGVDNRLYIREVEAKTEGSTETQNIMLSELSGDMQDKFYDFTDGLGLDDNMAFFIKQEVIRDRSRSDINFLKTFRDIISN